MRKNEVALGIWLAILSGAFYGTAGIFGIGLTRNGFGLTDFLFWRYLLIIVILLPFLNSKQKWQEITSKDGLKLIFFAAFFYESSTCFYFYAAESIGCGLATVLSCCFPFFVVILDWIFKKNLPSPATVKGLLIIMVGIFLLSEPHNWELSMVGIFWGLLCAIGFGIYFYFSKDILRTISPASGAFCVSVGNMVVFGFIELFLDTNFQIPNTWWLMCNIGCLAIVATLIPIYFFCMSLRYIDATRAAILSLFQPVITITLGIMFLNEKLTLLQFIGSIIVVMGALPLTRNSVAAECSGSIFS